MDRDEDGLLTKAELGAFAEATGWGSTNDWATIPDDFAMSDTEVYEFLYSFFAEEQIAVAEEALSPGSQQAQGQFGLQATPSLKYAESAYVVALEAQFSYHTECSEMASPDYNEKVSQLFWHC